MKVNQQVQPVISDDGSTVTFRVLGLSDLVLHMDRIHPALKERAAAGYMAQVRIVDAAAIGAADEDGNIIPKAERVAMKHSRMKALIDHLESGTDQWAQRAGGGGGRSIVLEAIAAVKGMDYAEAEEWVKVYAETPRTLPDGSKTSFGDPKKALAFLAKGSRVMTAIADIRAKRAGAPKVDADAELDAIIG